MTDLIDTLIADWQRQAINADPRPMAVEGRILLLAARMTSALAELLKPHGLNYSEFDVLATLRRQEPPFELAPKQLMDSILLTSGALSVCLDRLEGRGYIRRLQNPVDGRSRLVRLTPTGRTLAERTVPARFRQATENLACLSDKERDQLAALLAKLANPASTPPL